MPNADRIQSVADTIRRAVRLDQRRRRGRRLVLLLVLLTLVSAAGLVAAKTCRMVIQGGRPVLVCK